MKVEKHYERLNESLEVIDDCITKGVLKRQRTLGFSCSAAASDMVEIFLHNQNLIDPGFVIKHEWFASKNKINEKLGFEFEEKSEILKIMHEIESKRNDLCYGSPKEEKDIKEMLSKFNELKNIFKKLGVDIEK